MLNEEDLDKLFYETRTKEDYFSWVEKFWKSRPELPSINIDESSLPPALFQEEDGECGQECLLDDILSKANELDTIFSKIEEMKIELQTFLTAFYESCPRAAELFDEINKTYRILNKKIREMNRIKIDNNGE